MKQERKLILYISMSLDGFIATENDGLDWLNIVATEGEDYGYKNMQERCDTYIVGRKTYDVVLGLTDGSFPQKEMFKNCYVISSQKKENEDNLRFYSDDLEKLINNLKEEQGKDIYCDGGASLAHYLMQRNLIDEYIISIIPTLLGSGIALFKGGIEPINIQLLSSKLYESGLVQLHYIKI